MRRALPLIAVLAATSALASQTRWFVSDTPDSLAEARGTGVAVSRDGSIRPLPPLAMIKAFDEPLGLALALGPDGSAYVGTGHPARIWRVAGGAATVAAEIDADQVTDLLVAADGTLYATTAAPARLIRIRRGGTPETITTLPQGNLWALAWFKGHLVAAAGNPGRLLQLGPQGLELAADVPDQHARCLAVSGDTLLIGTSGRGLILRWTGSGPVGAFFDAGFTEVAALAVAADGSVYAAALTGDPTLGKPAKDEPDVSVSVSTSGKTPPQTDKGTSTSEIIHVSPEGAATTVHRFTTQIADTLAWSAHGLVIGTGLEGEIWQLVDGTAARLDTVDAAQVVRVAAGGDWVLTQGPVRLYHRTGAPHGILVSPVLDAGQPAHWGLADVLTSAEPPSPCTLRFRSGATGEPDTTWSEWTTPIPCGGGSIAAPVARYLQWSLDLGAAAGKDASVRRVRIAYRQINLAPVIGSLILHQPGEVFLKNPPPSDRIVEVQHPDLSGIFTTMDDADDDTQARLGKKYYRVGYQSASWKADDPNGDPLQFKLEIIGEGSGRWWTIRDHLETTVVAFDTQALADGRYRLRLTATDAPDNPGAPLTDERVSSWFTVDNTPPQIEIRRDGDVWVVTITDALSPLETVEWNRDADSWHALEPEDGVLDGLRETFRIPAASGRHVLAVRATDDHHNRATAAVREEP